MFSEEISVGKLSEKINDLLRRFEEIKSQNESLMQQVMTLTAENEAKAAQIQKLEADLTSKDIEADDILGKIEEVLRR
ncbi:hypothetical protein [Sulfurospirillum sp. 1612]|uniref:hypothetical protein n=1 Tax=Sulfurospirillum sp. 1612 TaxID=3094835 RepID=UPI002F932D6C